MEGQTDMNGGTEMMPKKEYYHFLTCFKYSLVVFIHPNPLFFSLSSTFLATNLRELRSNIFTLVCIRIPNQKNNFW